MQVVSEIEIYILTTKIFFWIFVEDIEQKSGLNLSWKVSKFGICSTFARKMGRPKRYHTWAILCETMAFWCSERLLAKWLVKVNSTFSDTTGADCICATCGNQGVSSFFVGLFTQNVFISRTVCPNTKPFSLVVDILHRYLRN